MQPSADQLQQAFGHILEQTFQTGHYQSVALVGKGEYGQCYGITFACFPYRAIVKLYKFPGIADQESHQLHILHTHLPSLVPQVYAHLPETALGEALIMEWLPGQPCPRPERLDLPLRASLQHRVVDLLVQLHSVEHAQGYGSFTGPWYPRWWDYYSQRIHATYQAIIDTEAFRTYLGPQVLALMERVLAHGERILAIGTDQPVLLHGDFCFGNLLFDPQTWRISGLIDPLDAEWGVRELDLVNLINGHILHFELLNRYRETIDLGPCFPLRYWFYQVWKWLFYYVRVQVPCRAWVLRCGRELEKAMDRFL